MIEQLKLIRRKYFKVLLSITIIISLGVALLFGLRNGILSVHKSIEYFKESTNYPDIKIITNLEDESILNRFNKTNYKSIDSRLSISTILKKKDNVISVKASTYKDKNINDFYVWSKKENITDNYDIYIEKKFAHNNNIKLGDIVSLKIDGKYYKFHVSKIVSTSESIATSPINGMWEKTSDYGNVYINKSVLVKETEKQKKELLKEVILKEEELNNEEKNKLNEFNDAKEKLNSSLDKYYKKKDEYTNVKKELSNKKDIINDNKDKLLKIKSDYINAISTLYNINNEVNSYINLYGSLSQEAKDYINNYIEQNYSTVTIDQVESITDFIYAILDNKINEAFDPNSSINEIIQEKIAIADTVKIKLISEYDYYNSEEINEIITRLKNGEQLEDDTLYQQLKSRLQSYSIFGTVTDDNILEIEKLTKDILNEINSVNNKLPFSTFSEFYNSLDNGKSLLPILYDSYKNQVKPGVEQIISEYNEDKSIIKNKIEEIYNSNKSIVEKAHLSSDLIYNNIIAYLDKIVVLSLGEYTDDLTGGTLAVIDKVLSDINTAVNEIDGNIANIDNNINSSYKLISERKTELDSSYNTFEEYITKAREQISRKKDEISKIKGYESKINEINIKVDNSVNKEQLLDSIKNNELKGVKLIDSYTYDNSPFKATLDYYFDAMEKVSTIVPVAFYLITLIVLFLFISLMIRQSKKEIAIMRLLGISKNKIRLGYILNNLIVSIFAIILGLIIGSLLIMFIGHYFKNLFMYSTTVYKIELSSVILCIIITVLVVLFATILATLELDKITPIEVLNNERYQNKEISKFTKMITSLFSPLRKFSLIVYVRNKRNLILGIICTSATFALIFTSLSYVASKNKILNEYFDDRINYDVQLFKKGNITEHYLNNIRSLSYVESADVLKYYNVTLKNNDKEVKAIVNALDNTNNYINIYNKSNQLINYPENGIVLEEHIARELGLKKNDYVEINNALFKITDISFQSMGRINYISLSDAARLGTSLDTLILKMDNNKVNEFISKVSNDNNYIYTVNKESIKKYNKKEFDSYDIGAIIIIIFTIITGFIIINTINNYNLLDQKKNLSIFRSLGFKYSKISSNWFTQSIVQCFISIIIGLPMGIMLSKFILKRVSSDRREFVYASGLKEILMTIILLFVYIVISHIISMKKIKKINIVEEVKGSD